MIDEPTAYGSSLRWTESVLFDFVAAFRKPWMAEAECRGMDPELFYSARGESTQRAREVCAACPVRAECLEHALSVKELFGIWGGESERTRRRLRQERSGGKRMSTAAVGNERRRIAAHLRERGYSVEQIASELRTKARTVYRYLSEEAS